MLVSFDIDTSVAVMTAPSSTLRFFVTLTVSTTVSTAVLLEPSSCFRFGPFVGFEAFDPPFSRAGASLSEESESSVPEEELAAAGATALMTGAVDPFDSAGFLCAPSPGRGKSSSSSDEELDEVAVEAIISRWNLKQSKNGRLTIIRGAVAGLVVRTNPKAMSVQRSSCSLLQPYGAGTFPLLLPA